MNQLIDHLHSVIESALYLDSQAERQKHLNATFLPAINAVANKAREICGDDGYIEEKFEWMKWHAKSMAEVDDGNNHSKESHANWLREAASGVQRQIRSVPHGRHH